MMTEVRGDSEGPWGVLNDWDHAKRVDAETTGCNLRTVRISRSYLCISHRSHLQGTWQFISVSLLFDATKAHDIFDDLESLYWVLLYMGVHYFKYSGKFVSKVFDEVSEDANQTLGKVASGGQAKNSWLVQCHVSFDCAFLEQCLTDFRIFHAEYRGKVGAAASTAARKRELERFQKKIQSNIYQLIAYFDDALNAPETDWSGQKTCRTEIKRITAKEERKRIKRIVENSITQGSRHHGGTKQHKSSSKERSQSNISTVTEGNKKRSRDDRGTEDDGSCRRSKRIAIARLGGGGNDGKK